MKKRIFSLTAIAAMCAMPLITNAEDKTVGNRLDNAIDKAGDALTPDREVNNPSMAPKLPAGIKSKENDDLGDVRGSLITIVNRTMTKDGLDGAVSYLANQDRDRINKQLDDDKYEGKLNAQVEQIRALFKAKYGEDFELRNGALDTATAIQQGEVTDAATARAHWPVPVKADGAMDKKASDSRVVANNDDPKFENGRDIAVVRFAGMKDKDALHLSMQHELPDYWVLDVANDVTASGIVASQTACLKEVIDMHADWPATKEEAYRAISYKILHGFYTDAAKAPVANMPRE